MEGVYKFVRQELSICDYQLKYLTSKYLHPAVQLPVFFKPGYSERKLMFVSDVILACKKKADELRKDAENKKRVYVYVMM